MGATMTPEISEETVKHVANLARLALSEEEVQRFTGDLTQILGLVAQLDELRLDDLAQEFSISDESPRVVRPDQVVRFEDHASLFRNAPEPEDGFFRVPQILETEEV